MVFILSVLINVGMWFERFVIITISLSRDFLPASWDAYAPTLIEVATLIGSFGLFFTLFLVFTRVLPMIAIGEVKGVLSYGRKAGQAPERIGNKIPGSRHVKEPLVADMKGGAS